MAKPKTYPLDGYKNCGLTIQARVELPNAAYITQAALTSANCKVENAAGTETYDAALTIANVVFDTLQNDSRWDRDSTGRNFLFEVPATAFSATGHHRVEVQFTPVAGEVFVVVWEGPIRSRMTHAD